MQQILSTSGSPCIPNPNKQAIQPEADVSPGDGTTPGVSGGETTTLTMATSTSSLSEKIGQIERLFLMGMGIWRKTEGLSRNELSLHTQQSESLPNFWTRNILFSAYFIQILEGILCTVMICLILIGTFSCIFHYCLEDDKSGKKTRATLWLQISVNSISQ